MTGCNGKDEDVSDPRLDSHLVVRDLYVLALASALAVIAAMVTGSVVTGVLTLVVLFATGVALMRVRSFRWAVNRLAVAVKGVNR